jgi:hypothetical protein
VLHNGRDAGNRFLAIETRSALLDEWSQGQFETLMALARPHPPFDVLVLSEASSRRPDITVQRVTAHGLGLAYTKDLEGTNAVLQHWFIHRCLPPWLKGHPDDS